MQKTLLAIIAAALVAVGLTVNFAIAAGEPADKASVSGSTVLVTDPGTPTPILTTHMRSSTPSDVTFAVTLECSIATELKTVGNDDQSAAGVVDVWVEVDEVAVPVATGDDGHVTFCNESHRRKTSEFEDEDATIETFDLSKQANAFNWTKLNMGNGVHEIKVMAELTETATNENTADAAIGKRTLTTNPTHMAVDETPDEDAPVE
jgi:hypothetical protein